MQGLQITWRRKTRGRVRDGERKWAHPAGTRRCGAAHEALVRHTSGRRSQWSRNSKAKKCCSKSPEPAAARRRGCGGRGE